MRDGLVSAPRSGLTSSSLTPNTAVLAGYKPLCYSGKTRECREAPMKFHLTMGEKLKKNATQCLAPTIYSEGYSEEYLGEALQQWASYVVR